MPFSNFYIWTEMLPLSPYKPVEMDILMFFHFCQIWQKHVPFFTRFLGQPQHRLWRWLSFGPDYWEYTDHCLLIRIVGEQRALQKLLHPLRWGLWDLLGWLEAWTARRLGHECMWVSSLVVQLVECFLSIYCLSNKGKYINGRKKKWYIV